MGLPGRVLCGAVAGAVGTLAMDRLKYQRHRDGGGEDRFLDWELSTGTDSFEAAGPPAQLGQKAATAAGYELPESSAGTVADAVHWLAGTGYGAVMQGLVLHDRRNPAASALATGAGAWLASYAVLGALGLYQPAWEYDTKTLTDDLTAHLVFGAVTAVTYRILNAAR